jgi:hypothetical protein
MTSRFALPLLVLAGLLCPLPSPHAVAKRGAPAVEPQDAGRGKTVLRVEVNLVLLNVAVTDAKGHYVTGLRPSDFAIVEDNIPQKIASFGEGNGPQRTVETAGEDNGPADPAAEGSTPGQASSLSGANVFVLFDTSNYMYRWTVRSALLSMPIAAIFIAGPCSPLIAIRYCAAYVPPWPAISPLFTTPCS